jgi:uncharacterized membrane protein (DUF373 family)
MSIQKIQTILSKLGIFRSGSYTWKGDAKDRPMESIDDDIYNAKKDYTTNKDIRKVKERFKSSKNKTSTNSTVFTIIVVLNILLVLLLIVSIGFNFGTVIAVTLIFLFRQVYIKGKFSSILILVGSGIALSVVIFFSTAMFMRSDEDSSKNDIGENTRNDNKNNINEIDQLTAIMLEVAEITGVDPELKENVNAGIEDGSITYLKGKSISGKQVPSALVRKISPLMVEKGFTPQKTGQIKGTAQVGGEQYDNGDITCNSMGGVYVDGYNKDVSSFSFNCAYTKNSAASYIEASEIVLE